MSLPAYIAHITLGTGHVRRSPRSEVDDGVVSVLRLVLAEALASRGSKASLPGRDDWRLSATAEGRSAMIATIWSTFEGLDCPLVTFGVARDSRSGAALWPVIAGKDAADFRRPSPPWLAVRLEVGATTQSPSQLMALGDLERCLAWAWLEERRAPGVADPTVGLQK